MLHDVTPLRWMFLQMDAGWVLPEEEQIISYQRSCEAIELGVAKVDAIQVALPGVLKGLRAAAPQLDATCVAPGRLSALQRMVSK